MVEDTDVKYGYGPGPNSAYVNQGTFEPDPDDPDSKYLDPNAWSQFEEGFFKEYGNPFDIDPDEEVEKAKAKALPLLFRHVFGRNPRRGEKLSAEEQKSWNKALGQFEKKIRNETKSNRSELMQRYTGMAGMFQKNRSAYIASLKRREAKAEKFKAEIAKQTKARADKINKQVERGAALSLSEEQEKKNLENLSDEYGKIMNEYKAGNPNGLTIDDYKDAETKFNTVNKALDLYDIREREDKVRAGLTKEKEESKTQSGSGSVFWAKDKDGNMYAGDSVDKVIRDLGDKGDINAIQYQKTNEDGSIGYAPLAPKLKVNLAKVMKDESLPQDKRDEAALKYNELFGKKQSGAGGGFGEEKPREKGPGFLGTLKRPDGKVSTELSIGVDFDGKETEIPSLVPTLSKEEIDSLLKGEKPTKAIIQKAVDHAKKRIAEGKSPFAQATEKPIPDKSIEAKKAPEVYKVKELPEAGKKALEVVAKKFVSGPDTAKANKVVEGYAKKWNADMDMNTETLKTIIREAGIVRGFTVSQLKLFLKDLKGAWKKAMELETGIEKG